MKSIHFRQVLLASLIASITLFSACNKSQHESLKPSGANGGLTGAGSTFIYPIMTRWISGFTAMHQGLEINYQSIGSGGGIQQLKKGLVDFGASDASLDDEQLKEMPPVIQVAESAGPVCITYNLPELKAPLKLSAATLSGIFMGKIRSWRDPAIVKDNAGVTLPNYQVAVAHRADGSGTTNIFTTYLANVSPDWQKSVGKGISVSWPVGMGGKGSEGVTGVVKQTPGAIGYVELNYAKENNLPVALVRNQAGEWVEPSAESATAAVAAFADDLAKDVRSPIVNPPASAKTAYPICGLTFLLIPKDGNDSQKRRNLRDFVQYILTDGQTTANQMYYAQLPSSLSGQDQKLLGEMMANGQPISSGSINGGTP